MHETGRMIRQLAVADLRLSFFARFVSGGNNSLKRISLSMSRLLLQVFMTFSLTLIGLTAIADPVYIPTREELEQGEVEIVTTEEKTVYEYRVAGRLMMIKIVP